MTPEPQVGDLLNITLTGVRVADTIDAIPDFGRGLLAAIPAVGGGETNVLIRIDSPAVSIERATPADELRRAAAHTRETAPDGDLDGGFTAALAELLDHLADEMSRVGAHESEVAGPAPRRATSVYNRHGRVQPAWTAALDLARAINMAATEDAATCGCPTDTFDCNAMSEPLDGQHPAWPPRQGDMWKDREDYVWFAVTNYARTKEGAVELVDELGDYYTPDIVASENGPLTLVSRKPADQ